MISNHFQAVFNEDSHLGKLLSKGSFLQEMNSESDRAVILICGAILDDALGRLISSFLIDDKEAKELVFGDRASLGSFATRTLAAYCMGLITKDQYDDLGKIRKIRNRAAHHLEGCSFDDQAVARLCRSLKMVERVWLDARIRGPDGVVYTSSPRSLFQGTTFFMLQALCDQIDAVADKRCVRCEKYPFQPPDLDRSQWPDPEHLQWSDVEDSQRPTPEDS